MSANFSFEELLSPYDFEILVRDLLSRDLGVELRAFAEGPDRGVDLRYSTDPQNVMAVQCKRTKVLGKAQLESEADKIAKLSVAKYYLAVAGEVSLDKCDQILNIFSRWMSSDSHIYSKSRLNGLLDKYPGVLRDHYKLWIGSSGVFDQFINNDLLGRSKFLKEDIAQSLKYYVRNEGYLKAVDILNKHSFLIISGIPGIGKTTLARILIWEYLQQGFEIVEIRSINEGERILREDDRSKQVLYFDDFLGENFLQYDVIQGRANDIHMFMKRFPSREGGRKKLIMTTREYILNQARAKYAKLDSSELDIARYILDLDQYSTVNKALILYNHLYYSNVGLEHIKDVLKDNAYEKIINHRNYSPRIIEAMTVHLGDIAPERYAQEFIANLDNPLRVWERAFQSELSECARDVLYLLASFQSSVLLTDLARAFESFSNEVGSRPDGVTTHDFLRNGLREMQDSFVRTTVTKYGDFRVEFLNPSVRDFMTTKLVAQPEVVLALIRSSLFLNQLLYTCRYIVKERHQLTFAAIDRVVHQWNRLESSELIQYREENSWHRYGLSQFKKLHDICNVFEVSDNIGLRNLVIADFVKLDLSQSHDSSDFYFYLKTLEKLVIFHEFDADLIMMSYIDNMYFADQASDFKEFSGVFSSRYAGFLSDNREEFTRRIYEVIEQQLGDSNDVNGLEQLIFDLDVLEKDFGLSLVSQRAKVLERIEELRTSTLSSNNELSDNTTYERNANISNVMSLFREDMFIKVTSADWNE